jgi:hypothetical protein
MITYLRLKQYKRIAKFLLLLITFQIIEPLKSFALTSGPSQPEMQSFEPVGTTDLVDVFSGDFNYNIPLLDVEGYPVNIAYHSGVGIEDEASWVGLGWNINVGNINHIVRGIPDDFNGDVIEKKLEIEPEKSSTFSLSYEKEIFGAKLDKKKNPINTSDNRNKDFNLKLDYNINNYSGISFSLGAGKSFNIPKLGVGVNITKTGSSNNGSSFDYSIQNKSDKSASEKKLFSSLFSSFNGGLNSREGAKQFAFNFSPNISKSTKYFNEGVSDFSIIPIGLQNYYPSITHATEVKSSLYQLKIGAEMQGYYGVFGGTLARSTITHEETNKKAFGYFYLENANNEDITDFARDKDGVVNNFSEYLPTSALTYDIYSINGQGTGGNFRAFRNDFGTVSDPAVRTNSFDHSHLAEFGIVGDLFEIGYDFAMVISNNEAGNWDKYSTNFSGPIKGNSKESFYFKNPGELTLRNSFVDNNKAEDGLMAHAKYESLNNTVVDSRTKRSSLLYFLNPNEAKLNQISLNPKLENYNGIDFANPPGNLMSNGKFDYQLLRSNNDYAKNRYDIGNSNSKKASEFIQVLPNGQRYIFGLPVMNLEQIDYEISVLGTNSNTDGLVGIDYTGLEPNAKGVPAHNVNKYLSKKVTPPFAHSYQLTAILSPDYVDVTGNGISDDDLGTYTKFNYAKKDDYNWRTPYATNKALRNEGLKSNCKDDKGIFTKGKREVWLLHSIETRNYIAEFITSDRKDALAADINPAKSQKLDKIVLYNKRERLGTNPATAVPIKTVLFSYDYTLCEGVENSSINKGKLTLKNISIKYGNSDIGFLSPYKFTYSASNANYNHMAKDTWGNYKPTDANENPIGVALNLNNMDFPYTDQYCSKVESDARASMWNLTEINLPSGGKIQVDYESDDYSYVQDKKACEMFKVAGMGPTIQYVKNNKLYSANSIIKTSNNFIYFKRKQADELYPNDIKKSYFSDFDENPLLQFNYNVIFSKDQAASCPTNTLAENVKGYVKVKNMGICTNNLDYAYLEIEDKLPETEDVKVKAINPITYTALNFARYYSKILLYPKSDIPEVQGNEAKILSQLLTSMAMPLIGQLINPIVYMILENKASEFDIDKSYIRLNSPGLKKRGGGERVKKITFNDNWAVGNENTYGYEYDYTSKDLNSGNIISTGVASYEPMQGGDENPFRNLLDYQITKKRKNFPANDPILLMHESPIGESYFPNASVGYSKVTVKSIHIDKGESVQNAKVHEFFTAKDFPIRTEATPIYKNPGAGFNPERMISKLFNKTEFEASQGYAITLNNMHGKLKQVSDYEMNGQNIASAPVAYTKYSYFTDKNQLNNAVPCLVPKDFASMSQMGNMANGMEKKNLVLGEEVDLCVDSRENIQNMFNLQTMLNVNVSQKAAVPIPIPTFFMKIKKNRDIFHSVCATKIIQQYGIVKGVETYSKGAKVNVENEFFDPFTGEVLSTKVNSEHLDNVYSMKYPAYWGYRNMGAASDNVLMEEELDADQVFIKDDKLYFEPNNPNNYNVGDEILFTLDRTCSNDPNLIGYWGRKYKLWITKKNESVGVLNDDCENCGLISSSQDNFKFLRNDINRTCYSQIDLQNRAKFYTGDLMLEFFPNLPFNSVPEIIKFEELSNGPKYAIIPLVFKDKFVEIPYFNNYIPEVYNIKINQSYTPLNPEPLNSQFINVLKFEIRPLLQHKQINAILGNSTLQTDSYPLSKIIEVIYPVNFSSDYVSINGFSSANNFTQTNFWPSFRRTNPHARFYQLWYMVYRLGFETKLVSTINMPRTAYYTYQKKMIEAKVMKIGEQELYDPITFTPPGSIFPANLDVIRGNVKVIRSGKRNLLQESIQDYTSLDNPIDNNGDLKSTLNRLLTANAKTFTTNSLVPFVIPQEHYNEYITGEEGNFLAKTNKDVIKDRVYVGPSTAKDKDKGTFPIAASSESLNWIFGAPSSLLSHNFAMLNAMYNGTSVIWHKMLNAINYSPWGANLGVEDPVGNKQANIMGYSNRLAVATVSNCEYYDAMVENFEDYEEEKAVYSNPNLPVKFVSNDLRKNILDQINPSLVGTNVDIVNDQFHSGKRCLKTKAGFSLDFDIVPLLGYPNLKDFHLNENREYVLSYWQKVDEANPDLYGSVKFAIPNVPNIDLNAKRKTPVIDGWALFEAKVKIPDYLSTPQIATLHFNQANKYIDDLRIFPATANMKSYVYNDQNRKVMAILDENNMSTFYEYDHEGKLRRVKKETEKGILTLQESRESLKKTLTN